MERKKKLKIKIFVLCYNEKTKYYAIDTYGKFEWASILLIETSVKELENIMYLQWLGENADQWKDCDFVGTLSWIANKKINVEKLNSVLTNIINNNVALSRNDVVSFYTIAGEMIKQTERNHPLFAKIWNAVLSDCGFCHSVVNSDQIPFIACNYWMAEPSVMDRYCAFQKKIKKKVDTTPGISSDTGYKGAIDKNRLLKIFGKPYYTYHPFVYERMIGFFLFTSKDLCWASV